MKQWPTDQKIILKDSTMREGFDVPGVELNLDQKRELLSKLAAAQIPEVELVAPGHFDRDLQSLQDMKTAESGVKTSGLIYGYTNAWQDQLTRAIGLLDRLDILFPLADVRPPLSRDDKSVQMLETLHVAKKIHAQVGVGFPHATQIEQSFLMDMCEKAVAAGAQRLTLYDTNGGSNPWAVEDLIHRVRELTDIELCFHAHNDLGLATANSIAAVKAGADCLDVTVNGLGDRAGNASLEQVAVGLHENGIDPRLRLDLLRDLSLAVEKMTGVPLSKMAPIVGDFIFQHKSPGHLASPELFEAFDPALVGAQRSLCKK